MTPEQAKELLEKYRNGLCTEEERSAIEGWFNSMVNDETWQWSDDERNSFKASLKAGIDKEISDEGRKPSKIKTTHLFIKYAAAASIMALVLTTAYFVFFHSSKTKDNHVIASSTTYKNDVKPGTDGAILTLANGKQVLLDSTGATTPIKDGNAQLINKDGKLIYAIDGNVVADENISYNTVQTPRARQYKLQLSDGTKVWLNAASSIRYPVVFSKKERVVEITGEVYFEVTKVVDADRQQPVPFTVHVQKSSGDAGEVQVLGTHFNINAYDEEEDTKTTLIEGKVRVKKQNAEVILLPGNQAKMNKAGSLTVVKDADISTALAWKNGLFSFDNAGVQVVMNQLARWYDIEVIYADGKIPADHFWGDMQRSARLSTVLKALENSGVKFTIEGNKVTVFK